MTEKKRVVTSSSRRVRQTGSADFNFTAEMIPSMANGKPQPDFMTKYRQEAWQAFGRLEMPKTTEEAWRRTDIRRLQADAFKIVDSAEKLPPVPEELLKPLVGERHGGQITITAGKTDVYLNPELANKGVVFTDLKTAVREVSQALGRQAYIELNPSEKRLDTSELRAFEDQLTAATHPDDEED